MESFYPSITATLLGKALEWAMKYVNLTPHSKRKSFTRLVSRFSVHEGVPWVKKGEVNFDIGMGAFHGARPVLQNCGTVHA